MAGIYIHIPFCKQACHYCDFHFSTNQQQKLELTHAIVEELKIQKDYLSREKILTIYFGGGTPSLLDYAELKIIIDSIYSGFQVIPDPEITLEANPDDLDLEKLKELQVLGVNRLSIGIQSFDDDILKFLNRSHNSTTARVCVETARLAGFENISLDLIYAIPGQSNEAWRENIKKALALQPEHISTYSLTIEEKTVFGRWATRGKLKAVEDDLAATQLEILMEELERSGFEQYEVSNFSQPGYPSQHNSSYWKQEKYLGVGPSAHSYNKESRQFNISNNQLYLRSIKEGKIPFELEYLTRENQINEYLLTTLRTSWGCDLNKMNKDLHHALIEENSDYLENLLSKNLATLENNILKLTRRGKLLADKIASDLFFIKE